MNILAIRFSSMGDVILQTPFLKWLKLNVPEVKIHLITLKENQDLVDNVDCIDSLHLYSKNKSFDDLRALRSFVKKLDNIHKFDFILDLHGTTRSFFTKLFLWNIPSLSMDKRRLERLLLVKTKLNLLSSQRSHHTRNIYDLYSVFNSSKEEIDGQLESNAKEVVIKKTDAFIVLAPGASFLTKRWPIENFIESARYVLDKYPDIKVKVLAGPEDSFCNEFLPLEEEYRGRINNLQGKTKLSESLKEVEGAQFVLCNDSLFAHVAESANVSALCLFGPTSEDFGFAPNLEKSKTFSVSNLKCRPCSTTGSKKCTQSEQVCFSKLDTSEIYASIDAILGTV